MIHNQPQSQPLSTMSNLELTTYGDEGLINLMARSRGTFRPKPIAWIKDGDCMICTSHRPDTAGYPCIRRNGKSGRIGRLILRRKHGKLGKLVMRHTCDNRMCISPAHIIIGTRMDNIRDMIERGRAWWLRPKVMTSEVRR